MKKYLIAAFLSGSAFLGYGQMILSSGSQIVINSGAVVVANNITNSGGTIKNNGDLSVLGNITNNTSGLIESSSSGTLTFKGSSAQEITGDHDAAFYGTVDINNSNGVSITNTSTGADQTINGTLHFTSGLLSLNSFNLTIGSTDPTGVGTSTYIKTNSSGLVKRSVPADGSTNVLFPVGISAYNPLVLQNSFSGSTDTYSVKVNDSKPSGFAGTTHLVNRSWDLSEAISGGSDLSISTQWNSGEELTGFLRSNSCIGVTTDNGSNVEWGPIDAASGSDPYTRSGSGVNSLGTFMVADYYYGGITIDLQAFLAAAYNTTSDNMDKTLNTANLLPMDDPYGLGQSYSLPLPSNAVDWVKIELRDKNNNTSVLYSFARFIDQSGQVIEKDESNFKMTGVAMDSYYIAIIHRNHFAVMSNSTVDLSASPSLNFKTAQATAWQDPAVSTNAAMKEVETGVFALWDGDANDDGFVKYNGSSTDRASVLAQVGTSTPGNTVTDTYDADDINMDGTVKYNGTSNDRSAILSVVGTSTPGNVYTEHIPE